MSSSASRAWITSGSPACRAAAICVRKTRRWTSRGDEFVVIVEPGLADPDAARMGRAHQISSAAMSGSSAAWWGWVPTVQNTLSCRSARSRHRSNRRTWVEIVTMRPTPADAARRRTSGSRSATPGKSRWQWLSTSIGVAQPVCWPSSGPIGGLRRSCRAISRRRSAVGSSYSLGGTDGHDAGRRSASAARRASPRSAACSTRPTGRMLRSRS